MLSEDSSPQLQALPHAQAQRPQGACRCLEVELTCTAEQVLFDLRRTVHSFLPDSLDSEGSPWGCYARRERVIEVEDTRLLSRSWE